MNTLSEIPDSVKPFVRVRKTDRWTSPAHPRVSVEFIDGEETAEIIDITITGSFLDPATQAFLARFGYQADEQQAFLDELAQFLHDQQPSKERHPMRAGEF